MRKKDETRHETSCWNKADDNEMIFVLLGRDEAASVAIEAWIAERIRLGLNTPNDLKIISAKAAARIMEIESGKARPQATEKPGD